MASRRTGSRRVLTCRGLVPREDHAELRLALMDAAQRVVGASRDADDADDADHADDVDQARTRLVAFCTGELLPHLERDERWLTQMSRCAEGRLLGLAMQAEARALRAAVDELTSAPDATQIIAATRVVHALLAAHTHHQNLLWSATGLAHDHEGGPG